MNKGVVLCNHVGSRRYVSAANMCFSVTWLDSYSNLEVSKRNLRTQTERGWFLRLLEFSIGMNGL